MTKIKLPSENHMIYFKQVKIKYGIPYKHFLRLPYNNVFYGRKKKVILLDSYIGKIAYMMHNMLVIRNDQTDGGVG